MLPHAPPPLLDRRTLLNRPPTDRCLQMAPVLSFSPDLLAKSDTIGRDWSRMKEMIDAPSTTLTHLTESGDAFMVDVGPKTETLREATAQATIVMRASTAALIQDGGLPKGDVLAVSRIAGLMGAKRTPDLIPLCHPIMITGADVSFEWDLPETTAKDHATGNHATGNHATTARLHIHATVRTVGKTGVEMEALTAATVSALTIYDMCKAVDRGMTIDKVFLLRKSGGRSGTYDASHDLNGEPTKA